MDRSMFIRAQVIKQPQQTWKWKTGLSARKKPSSAFLRYWVVNNQFGINDSEPTSTEGEQ